MTTRYFPAGNPHVEGGIEYAKAINLTDYEDNDGERVLKGLCDELFEHLLEKKAYFAVLLDDNRWRRMWYKKIAGLGTLRFIWEEPGDKGRTWLKENDRKFKRALKEFEFRSKDNVDVDVYEDNDDVISESSLEGSVEEESVAYAM